MGSVWINTGLYSPTQLFLYLGGFVVWGLAYVFVIRAILKTQFVEVPIIAVCGNVTWEILWGFFFPNDMGRLLTLLYQAGGLLDVFILLSLFRFGHKQVANVAVRAALKPLICTALVCWAALYIAFRAAGYDLPLGSNSAYLVNLVMSAVYILYAIGYPQVQLFSIATGWMKGIGTAMVTVFVFITYPDNVFVQTMGIVCAILDAIYMAVLYRRQHALSAVAVGS